MKRGNYILTEYQEGYSSFSPNYGDTFTEYRVSAGSLGAPTKPDTANQIQQVNQLLNQGIIPIEVGALSPEVFTQIPKQHFEEIKRMSKLTGSKISVHAPLVEPSGFTQQGWSETERIIAERQLNDVVEKSIELSDKESVPITVHSAGIPGSEYTIVDGEKKPTKIIVVDRETGQLVPLEEEKRHYPEYSRRQLERGKEVDLKEEVNVLNESVWIDSLSNIIFYKNNADRVIDENYPLVQDLFREGISKNKMLLKGREEALNRVLSSLPYLEKAHQAANSLFQKAWKYSTPEERERLLGISENFRTILKEIKKKGTKIPDPKIYSHAIEYLVNELREVKPRLYEPIEDFAIEKASKTFGNVAFNAYKISEDEKKPVPKISIENLYPGMAFAYGEDLKKLVEASRQEFINNAIKEGMSKSEAKRKAEEIIQVTLDVGHLNIAKKHGFSDEDLVKEVKEIAEYIGHVHLTDNFGFSDSHLPPGMGNVPIKEILEELEKHGKTDEIRKIVEAGGFVQHFGVSPFPYTLEGMGSPIYAEGPGPYWNQTIGLYQGYNQGFAGPWLPQVNYETFGSGFSQLPTELGGSRQTGAGSRMSGRPME